MFVTMHMNSLGMLDLEMLYYIVNAMTQDQALPIHQW